MPTYRYESKNAAGQGDGRRAQRRQPGGGVAAAPRPRRVHPRARRRPTPASKKGQLLNFSLSFGPGAKDVQNFTSQLAVMIRAGISIRARHRRHRRAGREPQVQGDARADEEGRRGRQAVLRRPDALPEDLQPAVHQHGEGVGTVRRLQPRCSTASRPTSTQQIETVSMVAGAMIYPGIIGTMADRHDDLPAHLRAAALHGDLQGQGSRPARADQVAAGPVAASWSTTGTSCSSALIAGDLGLRPRCSAPTGAGSGSTRSS